MQRSAEAARHHDELLDIKKLEMMLQNKANGVSVGELPGIGNTETLKEFNRVLEREITTW